MNIGHYQSTFECIDKSMESRTRTAKNTAKGVIYHVEIDCDEIPSPPYSNTKKLNCVVCTK